MTGARSVTPFRRIVWIAGLALFVIGVGWLHNRMAKETRSEIEAYCTLHPTGVWLSTVSDIGEQHSADCSEWNRQIDEADVYCEAHPDGVRKSPPNETNRSEDCRAWLEDN
jgi:hypothetical protein